MKSKILKTLFIFGLWSIPIGMIDKTQSTASKYLALGQMENSEVNYQLFKMADNIHYFNYFAAVCAIPMIIAIWRSKKPVEQK